jgi:hypothetical protein
MIDQMMDVPLVTELGTNEGAAIVSFYATPSDQYFLRCKYPRDSS